MFVLASCVPHVWCAHRIRDVGRRHPKEHWGTILDHCMHIQVTFRYYQGHFRPQILGTPQNQCALRPKMTVRHRRGHRHADRARARWPRRAAPIPARAARDPRAAAPSGGARRSRLSKRRIFVGACCCGQLAGLISTQRTATVRCDGRKARQCGGAEARRCGGHRC